MEATNYSETLVTYLPNYTALTSYTKIIKVPEDGRRNSE
jgi:hypothetical protein